MAMAILAMVSIPLMGAFTNAIGYSNQVTATQKATLLAQELMEGLKAADELVVEGSDSDGNTIYTADSLEEAGFVLASSETPSSWTADDSLTYYGKASATGLDYDVVITLNGTEANTVMLSQINSINADTDVFAAEGSQYTDAVGYFFQLYQSYCGKEGIDVDYAMSDTIEANLYRTITIELEKSNDIYIATIGYTYICDAVYTLTDADGNVFTYSGGVPGLYINNLTGKDNLTYATSAIASAEVSSLEKIYLLYIPQQNDDKLVITTSSMDVLPQLYLICQYTEDDDLDGVVDSLPASYHIEITNDLDTLSGIYTNLTSSSVTSLLVLQDLKNETAVARQSSIDIAVYKEGAISSSSKGLKLDTTQTCYVDLTSIETY